MKQKVFNVFLFTAGAVIGSVVTWKVVKTKYDRIVQEEIDSVKETWARMNGHNADEEECVEEDVCESDDTDIVEAEEDPDLIEYYKLASAYIQPDNEDDEDEVDNGAEGGGDEEVPYINGPYVITPDEYGAGDCDFELHCLTYYSDDVLTNDWDEVFDIEETIGRDSLEHFGEHAEDVVHVRNERLRADYEVVHDHRTYEDVVLNNPLTRTHAN